MILRVSVTCEAGHLLSPADPADSRAVAELVSAEHYDRTGELDHAPRAMAGVRALKRGSSVGQRAHCRACRKFIPYPTAECRCGFDNAAGAYRATGSALLPF